MVKTLFLHCQGFFAVFGEIILQVGSSNFGGDYLTNMCCQRYLHLTHIILA